ncbi:PREDICTED: uncharacterized protein LOC109337432 [Lupinus angustifolius]|uniref:uncharacterized protein LOC109337432 n=1 Tax=Lupinus angustifolius TaxID=3871 RepID=UPI00092F5962|nr:PREDICTED: uncharacterized protein LOC109337432 [Lupinus angustifolius]
MVQNPFELLLSLKQEGTVEAYVEEFEKYAGALQEVNKDFVRGIFLNGLKEEIRVEVKLYELETLYAIIKKVILIEQKNMVMNRKSGASSSKAGSSYKGHPYNRVVSVENSTTSNNRREGTVGEGTGSNNRSGQEAESSRFRGNYRRLTSGEMKEKREKGLCFRCDEPFTRGHVCKQRQLGMIIMADEEDTDGGMEGGEEQEALNSLQLSLYSMKGLTSTKSWKMRGTLRNTPVVIMIDCGASHNFIAGDLVDRLKLKVEMTKTYVVEVGDGHQVRCQGKCTQLRLNLEDLEVVQDFYLFGLKGVDLVLGIGWLADLGEIRADFGKMILSVKKGDSTITLVGDPTLTKTELSLGAFMQVLLKEGEGLLVQCDPKPHARIEEVVPEEIQRVLQQYEEVFQDPQGLPPARRQDHAIHLKEGAEVPNLRPYRYPHYQKAEIERLVAEMMEARVIRFSISPYSSPIILVKKKDGGWRFCVDYRALNKVTIPNKFPIPLVDELLDEIKGAKIFSKLDLKAGYHQIRMREGDVEKTAFRTHEGH